MYYGVAIDGACRLWQLFCGERGECWAYSLPDFRYAFIGISVGLKALSAFSYLMTLVLLKRKAGYKVLREIRRGDTLVAHRGAETDGAAGPTDKGEERGGEVRETREAEWVERETCV